MGLRQKCKKCRKGVLDPTLNGDELGVFFVVGVRRINQSTHKTVRIDQIYLSNFQRLISVLHPVA